MSITEKSLQNEAYQIFNDDSSTLLWGVEFSPSIDFTKSQKAIESEMRERGNLFRANPTLERILRHYDRNYTVEKVSFSAVLDLLLDTPAKYLENFILTGGRSRDHVRLKATHDTAKYDGDLILRGIIENNRLLRLWGRIEILGGDNAFRKHAAFEALIEHIPDRVYFKNEKHQFVLVNREKAEDMNLQAQVLFGKTDADFYPEFIARKCLIDDQRVLESGVPIVGKEERVANSEGELGWFSTTKIPWRDHAGNIIGTMGISRDITESKRMSQAYNAMYKISEAVHSTTTSHDLYATIHQILRELIGAKNMYIAIHDPDDNTLSFPYYIDENDDYAPPSKRKYGNGLTEYVIRTGEPFIASEGDFESLVASGEITLTGPPSKDWLGVPLRTPQGIIGVLTVQNYNDDSCYDHQDLEMLEFVSEQIALAIRRKQAEDALSKEREQLAVTLKSIGDGVITTDLRGNVLLMNRMAFRMTGWDESAYGRPVGEIFNVVHEKTDEPVLPDIFKVIRNQEVYLLPSQSVLITKNGSRLDIADSIAPLRDEESNLIGAVIIFRDVTRQRELEEEAMRARKLESVGTLAGGIAHDFNNILSGILGNISLARILSGNPDKVEDLLANAEEASRRASLLTKQLLTFAKGGAPVKETAALNEIIKQTVEFSLRGSNVQASLEFDPDLWPVSIDVGQIDRVIQNLIINADQAMPDGGTVTIRAKNVQLPDDSVNLETEPGEYVLIEIADEGIGISKEDLPKIFDPYFSTKSEGSGLGLATSYTIIQKHGGYINALSESGTGTIMQVYLPADVNANGLSDTHRLPLHSNGSKTEEGRILVMDDDENVRVMVEEMLRHCGYDVSTCAEGTEAIHLYREQLISTEPFDAVLLDLTIQGGMGGRETISELKKIDPEITAIVSSGYSTDSVMSHYGDYGFVGKVEKPYSMDELFSTLRGAIGNGKH